jgi:hypothetical protein
MTAYASFMKNYITAGQYIIYYLGDNIYIFLAPDIYFKKSQKFQLLINSSWVLLLTSVAGINYFLYRGISPFTVAYANRERENDTPFQPRRDDPLVWRDFVFLKLWRETISS